MILKEGNKNKKLITTWGGNSYFRYPVKTKTIKKDDLLVDVLHKYCDDFIVDGDIIAIAESVVAITQGRAFKISDIKPGFFARLLSRFVKKTPSGIGLGIPETMELAIREVGLLRILFAAFMSAITKPFGINGMFYRIAGERARGIDGPTHNTLPPYNEYASLLPKKPNEVISLLEKDFSDKKIKFCIIDANDIGVNLVGSYTKKFSEHMLSMFSDNPLGQGSESTPFLIIRKK
jgi:F420-0:gamma-glutamyl ligase-like protein